MSMKNILRAPLLAAALCLSTLTLHTVAFAQAASTPDAGVWSGRPGTLITAMR